MSDLKQLRSVGYDLIVNNFETLYRNYLKNVLLTISSSNKWLEKIPTGVLNILKEEKPNIESLPIDLFFEELYLWCLKEISIQKDIFDLLTDFYGERLDRKLLIDFFDEVNELRRKIAHAKSNITKYDISIIIEQFKIFCKGPKAKPFMDYIIRGEYNTTIDYLPQIKCLDFCEHNLPVEDYDLDGGYVGRRKEIMKIKKMLFSNQDRIISITGAGGLGKTALALKTSYSILAMGDNPYKFIIWFSAKENKLTAEDGIVAIDPQISDYENLLIDIIKILDDEIYVSLENDHNDLDLLNEIIYEILSTTRTLIIIDNLETILNQDIIDFIKDIPRPSQVLITSRKGLGEIERRYPLPDLSQQDGRNLFRIISKEKNRTDLLKLTDQTIENYVSKVKCYPLLIKWSIGKVCLGKEINVAFSEIYSGNSDISEFVFNDIYELLSFNSKKCLFAMIILGEKPVSNHMIQHLTTLSNDNLEDSLKELILSSFIFNEVFEENKEIHSSYSMLTLTRGFIQSKFDEQTDLKIELQSKFFELSYQIQQTEKSKIAFYDSLSAFGIKTNEDKVAFNYIKTAKNYLRNDNFADAEDSFKKAYNISPNLTYVLLEYAKFEFSLGHIDNCMMYISKAENIDSENFHIYYTLGIIQRKQNNLEAAINQLKKAKKFNSNYLPIYNELGRAYSFHGEYENAENEFQECLNLNSDIINYRYLNITLYYQADNFKRWSEFYSMQGNDIKSIEVLEKSIEIIRDAIDNKRNDNKNLQLERKICKELGVAYCKHGNIKKGFELLYYSASPLKDNRGFTIRNDENSSQANFFLASFGFRKKAIPKDKSLELLNIAMDQTKNFRAKAKIKRLIDEIQGEKFYEGTVKFYNYNRRFGVIEASNNITYTFIWSNIRSYIPHDDITSLEGKEVTFKVKKYRDKDIAFSVEFLDYS